MRRPHGAHGRSSTSPSPITTCRRINRAAGAAGIAESGDPQRRRDARRERARVRHRRTSACTIRDQGITHVIAPGAGHRAAGNADHVQRLPHRDQRRMGALAMPIGRRNQLRHVVATQTMWQKKPKTMRITIDGALPAAVTAKDVDPRDHRAHRHRRRDRPRGRICRLDDPRDVDGRPADGLQHVDRSRRAHRHDRAGRHDIRLSRTAARMRRRARTGTTALAYWRRCRPTTTRGSTARSRIDAAPIAPMVSWGTSPEDCAPIDGVRARPGAASPTPTRRRARRARARLHEPHARARRCGASRSTACSSARAPTPHRGSARRRRSRARAAARSCPAMVSPGSQRA